MTPLPLIMPVRSVAVWVVIGVALGSLLLAVAWPHLDGFWNGLTPQARTTDSGIPQEIAADLDRMGLSSVSTFTTKRIAWGTLPRSVFPWDEQNRVAKVVDLGNEPVYAVAAVGLSSKAPFGHSVAIGVYVHRGLFFMPMFLQVLPGQTVPGWFKSLPTVA